MRLTSLGIALAMMAALFVDRLADRTDAQIPERVLFQPGSYAGGAYRSPAPMPQPLMLSAESTAKADDAPKTAWEENFGVAANEEPEQPVEMIVVPEAPKTPPYLAYHRCPWTGRIHIIPYQKGYPDAESFPKHQSRLNHWLSSLPCREQNRPQIEYLSYYDPMPEIITDRPTRLQLILGYPNSNWTSACDNRWGHRQAQCKGIEQFANGPSAERSVSNQYCDQTSPQSHFGELQPNAAGFRGNLINRRGYYQAGVPVRYANNGSGHSWCSSCKKQCNHGNDCCPASKRNVVQSKGNCAPPDMDYPLKMETSDKPEAE